MGACQLDVPDEDASVQDHELLQCGSTFSDAFTRSDSAALDNGWQQVTGGLEIHSNEARSSALKATLSRAIRPSSTGPDQDVSAKFASTNNNSGPRFGLILRYQDPQNYYLAYRQIGGSSVVRIARVVNGAEVVLKQASMPNAAANVFFQLRGRAEGNTLSLDVDGITKLSVTDSTFSTGSVGLAMGSTGTIGASHRADEFSAAACGGGSGSSGGGGSSASSSSSSSSSSGAGGAGGGGGCVRDATKTSINIAPATWSGGAYFGAPTPAGGTVVAWAASGSKVGILRVDAAGVRTGPDIFIDGKMPRGLAVTSDGYAVLVERPSGYKLAIVKVDTSGATVFDKTLVGGCDTNTVGCEFYSSSFPFGQGGRLVWTGSKYAAYFPIYHHYPDNISHTGDTLRYFDANGASVGGGWGWGCSHSLDVRILPTPTLSAMCLSDCYPQKAILYNVGTPVSLEPSGSCTGFSNGKLGGMASIASGVWVTYLSKEGRPTYDVGLARVTGGSSKTWLTNNASASSAHLAPYEGGLLAAWKVGAAYYVQRLTADGVPIASPALLTTHFGSDDDFYAYPDGDVGWTVVGPSGFDLVRYNACP